jgi:7-cyano-7-deazaguanine synthase
LHDQGDETAFIMQSSGWEADKVDEAMTDVPAELPADAAAGSPGGAPAVVLLSGGLDSATCLALAHADGHTCHALSFRYGQRHAVELQAASAIAAAAGVEHVVVDIDLRTFGGSALTADLAVPKHDDVDDLDPTGDGIPITYVPARNTIFLSFALAFAEVRGARDIYIGVNALDYSGYPDCRPEYIEAYERMANLATKASVEATAHHEPGGDEAARLRIHTPLIALTKAEIITCGVELGVDYAMTTSCYDPIEPADGADRLLACGHCDSCLLRRKGFADAGLVDPIPYAPSPPSTPVADGTP